MQITDQPNHFYMFSHEISTSLCMTRFFPMGSASGLAYTFRLYNGLPPISTHEFKSYKLGLWKYFCTSVKVLTKAFCLFLCGKKDNLFSYWQEIIEELFRVSATKKK